MLKWFVSPTGEKHTIRECVEEGLLDEYYPRSYLLMCAQERRWTGTPSTTQLIDGTRMAYLKLLCNYSVDPDKESFKVLGTKAHSRLEKCITLASYAEYELCHDNISGIVDLVEPHGKDLWLIDYKTWGSYRVNRALGWVKKERPMVDQDGAPVLYKRSGKGYTAGQQRTESYYEVDKDQADTRDLTLQLNWYRYMFESTQGNKVISRLKAFATVRDGNTHIAFSRGIKDNTYYLDVDFMDDNDLVKYFHGKRDALLSVLELQNEKWNEFARSKHVLNAARVKQSIIECCPPMCTDHETWQGRRCRDYCEVSNICQEIGGRE